MDLEQIKILFETERDIPYRIPLSISETNNCCAGKHVRLKQKLESLGIPFRWRICWFRWSDLPIPKDILNLPHTDESTHLYLELFIDGTWLTLDASWDKGLAAILPVSIWSEPFKGTPIAVPAYQTLSPEESETYMNSLADEEAEEDLQKNGLFFQALNTYLNEIRQR
jgi:hypothetical protein